MDVPFRKTLYLHLCKLIISFVIGDSNVSETDINEMLKNSLFQMGGAFIFATRM